MTRSEELGLLLDIEYGFYHQYQRWLQQGRLSEADAARKIGQCCCVIAAYRSMCAAELQWNEYPESYFTDPPEFPAVTTIGANVDYVGRSNHSPITWDMVGCDIPDGEYQYSIFDYQGFINPM